MQPDAVGKSFYRDEVLDPSKRILWENVRALMLREFQEENITGFANWAKIGIASVQRIQKQKTSIGIDILQKIAKRAGNLEPWMLLVPDLDVVSPPMLEREAAETREMMERIRSTHEAMSGALRRDGNTDAGVLDESNTPTATTSKRRRK